MRRQGFQILQTEQARKAFDAALRHGATHLFAGLDARKGAERRYLADRCDGDRRVLLVPKASERPPSEAFELMDGFGSLVPWCLRTEAGTQLAAERTVEAPATA